MTHRPSWNSMAQHTELSSPCHTPVYHVPYAMSEIFLFFCKERHHMPSFSLDFTHSLLPSKNVDLLLLSSSKLVLLQDVLSVEILLSFSILSPAAELTSGWSRHWQVLLYFSCVLALLGMWAFPGRGHVIFHIWIPAPHPVSDTVRALTKHLWIGRRMASWKSG